MKYVRTYTSVYIPGAAYLVYRAAPASVPLFPKRQCDVTLRPVTDMGCCPRRAGGAAGHTHARRLEPRLRALAGLQGGAARRGDDGDCDGVFSTAMQPPCSLLKMNGMPSRRGAARRCHSTLSSTVIGCRSFGIYILIVLSLLSFLSK